MQGVSEKHDALTDLMMLIRTVRQICPASIAIIAASLICSHALVESWHVGGCEDVPSDSGADELASASYVLNAPSISFSTKLSVSEAPGNAGASLQEKSDNAQAVAGAYVYSANKPCYSFSTLHSGTRKSDTLSNSQMIRT